MIKGHRHGIGVKSIKLLLVSVSWWLDRSGRNRRSDGPDLAGSFRVEAYMLRGIDNTFIWHVYSIIRGLKQRRSRGNRVDGPLPPLRTASLLLLGLRYKFFWSINH